MQKRAPRNNVIAMKLKNASNCASKPEIERKRHAFAVKDSDWLTLNVWVNLNFVFCIAFQWHMKNDILNIFYSSLFPIRTNFFLSHADINECEENSGVCGHGKCINLIGAFKCFCQQGFQLDSSGKCIGEFLALIPSCLSHNVLMLHELCSKRKFIRGRD